MNAPTTLKVGPFTWHKEAAQSGCEVWRLMDFDQLVSFALKDYGGTPGPGFAGWKLVSGGPFDCAGAYASREAAMKGVVPYLRYFFATEINKRLREAQAMEAKLRSLMDDLQGEPNP